jgi:hypothetical protein
MKKSTDRFWQVIAAAMIIVAFLGAVALVVWIL